MAITLNNLPDQPEASVTDDDLLLIYEVGAGSNPNRKVTRARLLKDVPRIGGDATFGTVDADEVNAPAGSIDVLQVATGLTIGGGAAIGAILKGSLSVTPGTLAAGATEDQVVAMAGALVGDVILCSIDAPPAGLFQRAWVSGSGFLTFRFTNLGSGSVSSATYTARVIAIRAT